MKIIIDLSLPILEEYAYFVLYYVISRPHFKNKSQQEIWCNAQKDLNWDCAVKNKCQSRIQAAGGDKNPQLIKANEETNDWIHNIPPHCSLLLLLHVSELNVLMVLNATGWLETQMCSVSWLIVFQWTQKTLRVGGGALYHHHHHQICVFTVRKLTWCPLNHSCFPLLLQQCPLGRVLSAPSPTSSVSGKSPGQQEKTTQLWERLYV